MLNINFNLKKDYSLVDNNVCRTIIYQDTLVTETKPVAYLEQFFDLLHEVHCVKRMHQSI